MNAWQDYISLKIDVSMEFGANFKFPKIDLMSHWIEQIRRYGAFQQYSAERHKQADKTNFKDSSYASNNNVNYLQQVITGQRCNLCLEITELNLQALAQCREKSAATCKVLPSGADLAAPLSSERYVTPEFMGPQNHQDGKHSDAIIKYFRALRDKTQDVMHRVTIYHGTRE
jgi:hypothetical protein